LFHFEDDEESTLKERLQERFGNTDEDETEEDETTEG
jgi:hypothetical protein